MNRLKKIFKYTLMMGTVAAFTAACSSDDDNTGGKVSLNGMKAVQFELSPDKKLSETPTGATKTANGQTLKEYEVSYQKFKKFGIADLALGLDIDLTQIYPGSILRGSSFMKGAYDPLVLAQDFNPVTVFLTVKGINAEVVKENVTLKGSGIRSAINEIINGFRNDTQVQEQFTSAHMPAEYTYESDSVSTGDSFKKILNVHINKDQDSAVLSGYFHYDYSQAQAEGKKYHLIKFRQHIYTVGIDPKHSSQWVNGVLSPETVGDDYEPVYISGVEYGKVVYLLVASNMRSDSLLEDFKLSLNLALKHNDDQFGGSIDYDKETALKTWFIQKQVWVSVLGGSAGAPIVTDYKSLLDFINPPTSAQEFISSAAPISYIVRRLKDNTQVEMVNTFKDIVTEWKP
jgi:thiol-activated cytolysin